jgi:phosphate-selective porin OprO/OprP
MPARSPRRRTGAGPPVDADPPFPSFDNQIADPGSPVPTYEPAHLHSPRKLPVPVGFGPGPGLQFMTEDEQFRLQIHIQSQIEGRVWTPSGQLSAHDGFFFPHQRFFFVGNITKPIEYVFSMNRGLNGAVNILDSFLNFNFDERFQVRIGRYFTPLTYDQFAIRNLWLPTPERSLFTTNVGLGRQLGLMGWGNLFRKRFDHAAGFFNGSRNGFESLNNLDFVGFINARPFQESEALWFAKYLNIGTSVSYGRQDNPPMPGEFRVGAVAPDATVPGAATVPFLTLSPDVIEKGGRLLGSVHTAYFFRSLTLMGEWQYGNIGYATLTHPTPVSVPVSGYYATAAYFLTGEVIEKRDVVRPRRSLIPAGKGVPRGIGAWESDIRDGIGRTSTRNAIT